jgi:GDP-L-fucose synthase
MTITQIFPLDGKRVFVAGHNGMVGQAIMRRLAGVKAHPLTAGRADLDLRDQAAVDAWMQRESPDCVFLAAATVGGILANQSRPAEFIYDNLMIEANVIEASRRAGVKKLVFVGSSAVYPRDAAQPIREESLLTGPLEPSNDNYAVAKIAGIMLTRAYRRQYGCDFVSALSANLYGIGDSFNPESGHVVPSLMRRIHEANVINAPSVAMWGTGTPRREFLSSDDLADALVFLMEHYSAEGHVNVGAGADISIRELAERIAAVVGYTGEFEFDTSKPDGVPRKLMDVTRMTALGWKPSTDINNGLAATYAWFLANQNNLRG